MRAVKWIAAAVLLAVLGCGSSRDASKSNFQKALERRFTKECLGLELSFPAYLPQTRGMTAVQRANVETLHGLELRQYEALIEAGLLSVSDGVQVEGDEIVGVVGRRPARVYQLTQQGAELYRNVRRDRFRGNVGILCVATIKVDGIESYSEPAPVGGFTVSRVAFTYSAREPLDWASRPAARAAYPQIERLLANKGKGNATLVLMDTGWVHEKDVQGLN